MAELQRMRWYNPEGGSFEWREVPKSDEDALSLLSLRFNQEGICDGVKPIANPLALALFIDSGSRFYGRVAFRSPREAAFGSAGRPTAGFRSLRRGAHRRQECRETPKRPAWRQPPVSLRALPWQAAVLRARAGLPQLGVGQEH